MKSADAAGICLSNLLRRKGRTVLTLVGVVIGVAALVMIVSLAIGLEREVLKIFQGEDSLRTLFVSRGRQTGGKQKKLNTFSFFRGIGIPLTERDLEEISKLPGVATVRPTLDLVLRVDLKDDPEHEPDFFEIGGVSPDEEQRLAQTLVAGRLWKDRSERAVVIPSRMLALRFDRKPADILGKKLVFSKLAQPDESQPPPEELTCEIVGVVDSDRIGMRLRQLLVPMERALELREVTKGGVAPLISYKKGSYIAAEVLASDMDRMEDLKRQLGNSGYQVVTTADMMGTVKSIFFVIEGFMACIGAIGLIVSIFGIANTMAMAVLERTREIGIMKALGARNGDVARIFLLEAGVIGLVGGLAGLGAGAGGGSLLNLVAHQVWELPPEVRIFHVSLWLAAGAMIFSVIVSMVAGFMPARRAAGLDPVRALRYE